MQISRKIREVDRRRNVSISRILLAAFLPLAAGTAMAQTNLSQYVQHVIIVIQENRTPTNLFQQDSELVPNDAHLVSPGYCGTDEFGLSPLPFVTCYDTNHNHQLPSADWVAMWDNGKMDGACAVTIWNKSCSPGPPACPDTTYKYCPAMTYVQNTVQSNGYGILQPYFDLANQYGFANYMFATNQGPSFPAHQFLFSGTSAPTAPTDLTDICTYNNGTDPSSWYCYQWFDAENVTHPKSDPNENNGCIANSDDYAFDLDPASDPENLASSYTPPSPTGVGPGFPCYEHPTLTDLLDNASPNPISWKYYASYSSGTAGIWTAPTAINHICHPSEADGTCQGKDYGDFPVPKVVVPGNPNNGADQAPILTDIENCNLPQVSWVIPDGHWSDHGGVEPGDGGPSWVAWIVNAVGNSYTNSGGACDYWGTNPNSTISQPTVILVTWDDWGGLYDDVPPPDCSTSTGKCSGYFNGTQGNGQQYVYGFRVPLLVIGAYTNTTTTGKDGFTGYISGPNAGSSPDCTPPNSYCHDFGSILNFIEYAFGTGTRLGGQYGISGQQGWPYADYFAMDYDPTKWATTYSLSDFFNFSSAGYHGFKTINSWYYQEKCFHQPLQQGCFPGYPAAPDNDENETD